MLACIRPAWATFLIGQLPEKQLPMRLPQGGRQRRRIGSVDVLAESTPDRARVQLVLMAACPAPGDNDAPLIQERPEFVECDKITGDDPFLARLVVHSIEQMDDVLEALSEHAVTSTAVIKGTSIKRRLPPL